MMLLLFFVGGATNVMAGTKTGTIAFSSSAVNINAASVTGDDDLGNTWTITTEGETYFSSNAGYCQVGSAKKPASSITFTTTLPKSLTISAFSAKFGGFNGTAGTISLKVGNTEVGSGELNGTNDVTVSSSESASGTTLTVTVTDIAKGVKCYNISYSYEDENSKGTSIISFPKSSYTATLGETFDAPELTITAGDGDVTYSSDDNNVASVSYDETGAVQVTLNGAGTAVITATIAETDDFASATTSYTLTVNEPVAPYEIQDGLFEVTLVRMPRNPLELSEIFMKLGNPDFDSQMVISFQTSEITLKSDEIIAWTRDGEYAGAHKEVHLKNCHEKLKILVPASMASP